MDQYSTKPTQNSLGLRKQQVHGDGHHLLPLLALSIINAIIAIDAFSTRHDLGACWPDLWEVLQVITFEVYWIIKAKHVIEVIRLLFITTVTVF